MSGNGSQSSGWQFGGDAPLAYDTYIVDAEQLRQSIVDAGFRDVEIRVEAEIIRHASLEEYVPGYISATPVAGAVVGLDAAVQSEIVADVRDALGAYRAGDGLVVPIEAHLAIGHR